MRHYRTSWCSLPTEMKLAVVQLLNAYDIKILSKVDQEAYTLCIPTTFKHVTLANFEALQRLLDHVPRSYYRYIHQLDICTVLSKPATLAFTETVHFRTDAVISLLRDCPHLQKLSMQLHGGLASHVLPCFPRLHNLRELSISNCASERDIPLSERLVVSIAASVPHLEQLTLDRISRSTLHAPELLGVYPFIPLVSDDSDIDDHPQLGSALHLPSLLRIPSLKRLTISDTHLGDSRWLTTPVACNLEILHLGSCPYETHDMNGFLIEHILSTVGSTVGQASLSTAIVGMAFSQPSTPLKQLRKLHITPLFPVDSLLDTLTNVCGSPIETLSVQCFEDDIIDACEAIEHFLCIRVERGPPFYANLVQIEVSVVCMDLSCNNSEEYARATIHLKELCDDLRLDNNICDTATMSCAQQQMPRENGVASIKGPEMAISC